MIVTINIVMDIAGYVKTPENYTETRVFGPLRVPPCAG
jgi:hypothetical protein